MSQPAQPTNALRTFLKWGGIALLLTAAVWIGVIIWWQTTHRVISFTDVLLYLIVLPFFLLLCIGIFKLMRAIARKKANASAAFSTGEKSNDPAGTVDANTIEKKLKLPIVGAWAVTSLANNAEEFVQALIEKRSRPRPDQLLLDARGFPLPSGRVMDLDIQTVQQKLSQTIAKNGLNNVPDSEEWRDAFLRTLALLDQVIDQAHNEWPLEFETADEARESQSIGTLRGAAPVRSNTKKSLSLQIKLLIPADFKPYEKQLSLAYLFEKISIFTIPAKQVHIEVVAASDDVTALSLMDKFSIQTHRNGANEALLLLAGDSTLCPTVAEDWHSAGRLFSTHCPNGLMMGEAAFGVLCINNKALKSTTLEAQCQLTRVSFDKRDSSADQPGKPSYTCLAETMNDALITADLSGEKIGTVACDADHRTNRTLECIGAMMNLTPQLDAIENRLAANEACGHIGTASVLGAFVAGVTQVKNANHPILLFNVSHMVERAAAVLLPNDDTPDLHEA
ncbi:MAG TPA: hypothetical protein VIF82_03880 [Burkholderiaceae bacterium]|jgi:hypothetical protein